MTRIEGKKTVNGYESWRGQMVAFHEAKKYILDLEKASIAEREHNDSVGELPRVVLHSKKTASRGVINTSDSSLFTENGPDSVELNG